MSDKIADAIRLLVEDGAEITYPRNNQQPTDYYQGIRAGIITENKRITDLLQNELGAGVDIDETNTRDAIIKQLIDLIGAKND